MEDAINNIATPGSGASIPDPEVSALPRRRRFTGAYKLEVLRQAGVCKEAGELGALLRREGLYSSHLSEWRKLRDKGALSSLSKRRGRPPANNPLTEENERLRRETSRLQRRLERAEGIIAVQKKLYSILGLEEEKHPALDGSDS